MSNIHQSAGAAMQESIQTTVVLAGLSRTLRDVNQRIDAIQETVLELVQTAKMHNSTQLQQLQHLDFASQAITDIVSAVDYLTECTSPELNLDRNQLAKVLILEKLREDLKLSEEPEQNEFDSGSLNLF